MPREILESWWAGVAPYAGATAGNAELLGRLATFVETLFGHLRQLRDPRPSGAWAADLTAALEDLCEADSEEEESAFELVRDAFDELARVREQAGLTADLSLAVVRAHLRRRLAGKGFGSGFISGRITFCALKPMRTLPFKVICIAGLNDGAFPRRDIRHSFDLTARSPRPGDRSLREDDRYLFLETLLAASRQLILTYQGRSQKDNRKQAPAVVVSELLDYLDRAFRTRGGRPARERVVVEHRLHPFSPDYYGAGSDPRLFSYSRENCRASRSYGARQTIAPFWAAGDAAAAEPGEPAGAGRGVLEIELPELTELWLNPARHYCRKVLRLGIDYEARPIDEAEPFGVDFLERYRVNQWLLARRLSAAPAGEGELDLLRGRGELPFAGLGSAHYARFGRQVDRFVATLPSYRPREPILIDLTGDGWRLTGRLEELTDVGMLRFRCANLKPKDLLRAWVAHVARNVWEAGKPSGLPLTTHVVGTDRGVRFGALAEAPEVLESLVQGYRQGLERAVAGVRAGFSCLRRAAPQAGGFARPVPHPCDGGGAPGLVGRPGPGRRRRALRGPVLPRPGSAGGGRFRPLGRVAVGAAAGARGRDLRVLEDRLSRRSPGRLRRLASPADQAAHKSVKTRLVCDEVRPRRCLASAAGVISREYQQIVDGGVQYWDERVPKGSRL